ncbi:capping protein-inhibiting regulator of actin dynamics isoform X1 [Equus quagga]|uniref:capping protein-inhibiting regulator of actin dynamics isoform X1 n=2 Tax=Equus quagga TaxID=89248 RepID=UPI001EE397A0|nr:capping protein-inhibiting regulator of actin dynamics isoform X1 [Equus quagga]XP_046512360.1 capping protein-inhibiting regulator of actin dynamics isoform X1 [Equus quagga]
MGTRAFSHDSIFIPDGGAESEQTVQAMSQDNILGKVKTLQRQLGKNIKFGQPPPKAVPMKKADSGEASLEEDLFLTSPMEIVTQQDIVLSDTENKSSATPSSLSPLNLPGARSEMEEKVVPVKPSRPKRHFSSAGTIESVNLDAIPLVIARLDNSAAKHKLAVKPKNQRVSKKHRRLARDRPSEQDGLLHPLSLDQNGHPVEDKLILHEEEPELLEPEEEKRRQEEYWRELEAKCKRQKAEAAERRRLEEQRLQALERRLWEENRRQELLEEEEGEERELQLAAEKRQQEEERQRLERQGCQGQEQGEQEERRHLEAEEQKRLEEEVQRLEGLTQQEELEAQSRQEAEKQRQEEEERELKELRRLEELEEQRRCEAEKQWLQEEERRLEELRRQEELEEQTWREEEEKRMKELRRQEELEEQRRREAQKQWLQEEERRLEELRRQEELEEQRRREEEEKRMKELRRQEELEEQRWREEEEKRMKELRRQEELEEQRWQEEKEAKRKELLKKQEEVEAQKLQEAEKKHQEGLRVEDESQPELADKSGLRSPLQTDFAEKPEEREHLKPEKQRENSEEPSVCEKQSREAEPSGEQQGKQEDVHGDDRVRQEKREETKVQHPRKQEAQGEEKLAPVETKEAAAPEKERKVEELRWQEVDERQTMPRPYTFQVSSGGKQILFPKVNLSPVTPVKDAGLASAPHEPKAPKASPASHALPSSLSIPHTAILVTGAQLCGPAVNLSQIKDTACKSLLGLSEEKKHLDVPALENPPRAPVDPRAGSGKAKPPQESPSSVAALAEWASIRSRILKNADSDQRSERDQGRPRDGHSPRGRSDSRGNLRKTPPVNAKFSIMPAWQKFSDGGTEASKQNTEAESIRKRPVLGPSEETAPQPLAADPHEHRKGAEKLTVHREPTDTTEGCKFAKDLPSFLVPSLPYPPQKAVANAEPVTTLDSETTSGIGKPDPVMPGGEEKASPFGIKLRRTNYSLRFHCDQQAEQKKKKRHSSTGDSIEGGPPAPGSTNGEKETDGVALRRGLSLPAERKQALSTWKDPAESPSSHSAPAAQPRPPRASSQTLAPEQDKAANRMPLVQKPALAPKPASQTPPSSPLPKLSRPYLVELLARRAGKPDPEPTEPCKEGQESGAPRPPWTPPPERKAQKRGKEEEVETERRFASPAPSATRQEKPSQTPEAGRKVCFPTEKPVLQSRHSLDGSKLAEKGETAQPLWITLALQKQKGFREQQATREERKQARETKQAEKLSKENVSVSPQPGSSSVSRPASLHKSTTQPEEKQLETAVSRLERREQLKKANTLPTSVTVEISDSAPPAPLVKEVTKRFSTPDAAPVSTEPAWLALAKRKAKAWSDCPQIIK